MWVSQGRKTSGGTFSLDIEPLFNPSYSGSTRCCRCSATVRFWGTEPCAKKDIVISCCCLLAARRQWNIFASEGDLRRDSVFAQRYNEAIKGRENKKEG